MELEGKGLVNESQAEYLLPGRNVMVTGTIFDHFAATFIEQP
jgi:hypothetical protein|tara:strand:+ start:228 stop:353 length:126 start_codon:yes stop_codon:yes gene_type:complete